MKKSFTLIELIIVIVIVGILGTISVEILQMTYNNYAKSKILNSLSQKTDLVLNVIASKLQNRIKNSVIAVECNATNGECLTNSNKNFVSLSTLSDQQAADYPVLEWLYISKYSKMGIWDSDKKHIQPGWSGFVDLKETNSSYGGDEYDIVSPDSKFSIVESIDGNWSDSWGVSGYSDVFENNLTVLIFGGSDGRGDFEDINNSYGYYDNNATRVFAVVDYNDSNNTARAHIKAITESNSTTVYELYYLVRGAMAVVPVYDSGSDDYNLTLRFNYFPWKGQMYMDGSDSLLATHVVKFKFKEEGGVMRIYICIQSDQTVNGRKIILCKEKVVF